MNKENPAGSIASAPRPRLVGCYVIFLILPENRAVTFPLHQTTRSYKLSMIESPIIVGTHIEFHRNSCAGPLPAVVTVVRTVTRRHGVPGVRRRRPPGRRARGPAAPSPTPGPRQPPAPRQRLSCPGSSCMIMMLQVRNHRVTTSHGRGTYIPTIL